VYFQLKAAETLPAVGSDYVFDLDIRDYNLWMLDKTPVILVLFDASRRQAYWLAIQVYFKEDATRQPKKGAKTVRVRVPKRLVVSRRAIARIRDLKGKARGSAGRGMMKRTQVTYGQLDKVLRSFGFTSRVVNGDPPARVYDHKETGASIMMPPFPDHDRVLEYHLVTARVMLDEFGIADPTAFAAKLQKAG
jgi:hypothetical protein